MLVHAAITGAKRENGPRTPHLYRYRWPDPSCQSAHRGPPNRAGVQSVEVGVTGQTVCKWHRRFAKKAVPDGSIVRGAAYFAKSLTTRGWWTTSESSTSQPTMRIQ